MPDLSILTANDYIAAAERHGEDYPDHEVGDLQDLFRAAFQTTGGFLLEDDGGDDHAWKQIAPSRTHTLSPNARLALDIAEILGPRAIETIRPIFNDRAKLANFAEALLRRLGSI